MKNRETDSEIFFNYPSEEETKAAQALCCGRVCGACETPTAYAWRKRAVDMSLLLEEAMKNELTVTERETLKAFWFESVSISKIARLRGISSAAVSDTVSRAEEKLKRALRYAVLYQHDTLNEETVLPLAFARARAIAAARNAPSQSAGERVKLLRMSQGLSCAALSRASGIAQSRLKAIEEGKAIYGDELAILCGFFGITADSLIYLKEEDA